MLNRVKIVAVAGAVIILLATVVVWATAGRGGDDKASGYQVPVPPNAWTQELGGLLGLNAPAGEGNEGPVPR